MLRLCGIIVVGLCLAPQLAYADGGRALGLIEALRLAKASHPVLKVAGENRAQSRLWKDRAWAEVLPDINAQMGFTYDSNTVDASGDPFGGLIGGLVNGIPVNLSDPNDPNAPPQRRTLSIDPAFEGLADGGGDFDFSRGPVTWTGVISLNTRLINLRALPLLDAAAALMAAGEHDFAFAEARLYRDVAELYLQALAQSAAVEVAEKNLETVQRQLGVTERRVTAGTVPKTELLASRAGVVRARRALESASSGVARAQARLGAVIGEVPPFALSAPPTALILGGLAPELLTPEADEQALLKVARESRIDLKAADQRIEAAGHQGRDALYAWLPTLGLNAAGRWTSQSFVGVNPYSYTIGLTLDWALFSAGRRLIDMKQTESQTRAAIGQREVAELEILSGLRDAKLLLAQTRQDLSRRREELGIVREQLSAAEALYEGGAITGDQRDDAASAVFTAELELVAGELNEKLAMLALAWATGRFDPGALN